MEFKAAALGGVLLIHALSGDALTLGALQGNAWLGRRLDVSVTAQLDAGQSPASVCASADVFHADAQVDRSRVQVLTEPTERANEVALRIVSSAVVDEPIVTIRLRVGCESEVARRYVLLPDAPGEFAPALPNAPRIAAAEGAPAPRADMWESPASAPAPGARARAAQPAPDAPLGSTKPSAVPKRTPPGKLGTKGVAAPAAAAAKAPVPTARAQAAVAPGAGRGKLTLEGMVLPLERATVTEPPANAAPPEASAESAQRMELLQAEIKTLLDQAALNAANQRALLARLEKAEEARLQDSLVYWLAGLLTLCLVGTVVYLRRSAVQIRLLEQERQTHVLEITPTPSTRQQESASESPAPQGPGRANQEDADWLNADDKGLSVIMEPALTRPVDLDPTDDLPKLQGGAAISTTDFNAEEQLALMDQAQLFVRLDKAAHAIDILEERIRHKATDCPLVFLELLKIAHTASLKVDFRQFRDEMQQVFNVAVPEFALFKAEGRRLEGYPELSQRLAQLGQTPQALTDIESCMVLSAWSDHSDALDLAAFKDLVHLHGTILKALLGPNGAGTATASGPSESLTDVDLPL